MSLSGNGRGAINPAMQQKAGSLYKELQQIADPSNLVQMDTQGGGVAGKFPVQLGTADPMDVQMAIRQQAIADGKAYVPGMGMAIADQPVFDYLERKKEDEFMAMFMAYVNAQADLGSPAEAAWWFERFPWLKEKRLEEINRASELEKRLAQIQVTGVQNEDDMKLMFAIDQKLITIPTVPVNKLYEDKSGRFTDLANFKKGLFSPLSQKPGVKGGIGLPDAMTQVRSWKDPFNGAKKNGVFPGMPTQFTGAGTGLFPM